MKKLDSSNRKRKIQKRSELNRNSNICELMNTTSSSSSCESQNNLDENNDINLNYFHLKDINNQLLERVVLLNLK